MTAEWARIHVVPVGTSLLRRFQETTNGLPAAVRTAISPPALSPARVDSQVRHELARVTDEAHHLRVESLLHPNADTASDVSRTFTGLPADICAELNSLDKSGHRDDLPRETVVLVATDTDDGLRAGALLAHTLATRAGTTPLYIDDPADADTGMPAALDRAQVLLVRIPNLDLNPVHDKQPNADTWRALGAVGRTVAHTACHTLFDWSITFHLSGGYKALLPHLLVLAEAVHTVTQNRRGERRQVNAVVLHEDSMQPRDVPVRWITGSRLDLLLDLVKHAGDNDHITVDELADLRGYYLEGGPFLGRRALTEAGLIMVRTLWALITPNTR